MSTDHQSIQLLCDLGLTDSDRLLAEFIDNAPAFFSQLAVVPSASAIHARRVRKTVAFFAGTTGGVDRESFSSYGAQHDTQTLQKLDTRMANLREEMPSLELEAAKLDADFEKTTAERMRIHALSNFMETSALQSLALLQLQCSQLCSSVKMLALNKPSTSISDVPLSEIADNGPPSVPALELAVVNKTLLRSAMRLNKLRKLKNKGTRGDIAFHEDVDLFARPLPLSQGQDYSQSLGWILSNARRRCSNLTEELRRASSITDESLCQRGVVLQSCSELPDCLSFVDLLCAVESAANVHPRQRFVHEQIRVNKHSEQNENCAALDTIHLPDCVASVSTTTTNIARGKLTLPANLLTDSGELRANANHLQAVLEERRCLAELQNKNEN